MNEIVAIVANPHGGVLGTELKADRLVVAVRTVATDLSPLILANPHGIHEIARPWQETSEETDRWTKMATEGPRIRVGTSLAFLVLLADLTWTIRHLIKTKPMADSIRTKMSATMFLMGQGVGVAVQPEAVTEGHKICRIAQIIDSQVLILRYLPLQTDLHPLDHHQAGDGVALNRTQAQPLPWELRVATIIRIDPGILDPGHRQFQLHQLMPHPQEFILSV